MADPGSGEARLLIVSPGAGALDDETCAHITQSLPGYAVTTFDASTDVRRLVSSNGTVVVAGGDGSVGSVVRRLAGSDVSLGIVPAGTYNNFAIGMGIPTDIDEALAVIKDGARTPVTLGMVGDVPFLETAAIGIFGRAIDLGEAVKDGDMAAVPRKFRRLALAKPFDFTVAGDIDGHGSALSLVFSNTPTTGARLAVGTTTPEEPVLELSVKVGASRRDLIGRLLGSVLFDKHADGDAMAFRFRSITVTTSRAMAVYADNRRAGTTPCTIRAATAALHVLAPR